ncbi:hypothetical protein Tco_1241180 [Tanacetum coccineum]
MVGKKKKRKGKSKSTNGGQFVGPSVKQNVRYELKVTTSAPKKGVTNVGNSSKSSSTLKTTGASSKNDNIITHFYVVVFNIKKPTSMIILDNSYCRETYGSKYKAACVPLKMFDLAYKFETENDEQTRISIIMNAIKYRAEHGLAKTVVENQEGDAVKTKSEQVLSLLENLMVNIDDPNITMEEYIRLEEEKARRRGKMYNWETATYGKIWYNEDVHNLRSVETEFPAIVFDDAFTSKVTLSCEATVSPPNDNKIDFRISFDKSVDEDYTVIYDKNSFSYKIISVDDLKTDLKNDNNKVNMPSFPSPKPTVSYFNDLDFFKDFENEFLAIVYNNALTSKLDFLTEPTVSPQHIDEFNLKDETSLSECDEEEQNVLYIYFLLT